MERGDPSRRVTLLEGLSLLHVNRALENQLINSARTDMIALTHRYFMVGIFLKKTANKYQMTEVVGSAINRQEQGQR